MKRHLIVLPLALVAPLACGGGAQTVVGKDALAQQANIRASCDAAERGHDDPFTVEWDATDVASFEARAQRDTVFVRYHGCELEVLDACGDPNVPGQLGAYGSPTFTSGAERAMEIKNEGDLYAELPLGAAKLGGRVSAGESLRLRYAVAGVANATRGAVYRQELARYGGCAGATHFVAGYNLGAFVVETMEKSAGSAGVSIGNAGGGGSSSHEQSALGAGGDIASCSSAAKQGCRVPIRLHLRRIEEGAPPAAPSAPPAVAGTTAAPGSSTLEDFATWANRVETVKAEASEKLAAGDAKACLASLDVDLGWKEHEALPVKTQASMAMIYEGNFLRLKADCQAASGDCATARATMRDSIRLGASGNDAQMPGRHLKEQAEQQIADGGDKKMLAPRCQ